MRRLFYILIMVLLLTLCGCGQVMSLEKPAPEAAVGGLDLPFEVKVSDVDGMPVIFIYMEGEPGEEYAKADIVIGDKAAVAEIKLRGNSSRESAKKAYTVKFEDEQELLGMESGKKWALVSNPFDKSLLRPAVGFAFAEALGLPFVSETRLCKVYLNEFYMGVYTAMEPVEAGRGRVEIEVDDFLLERNLGRYEEDKTYIDSPSGMRFEFNEPEEPDAGQRQQCYDMLAAVEEAVFSGDHNRYSQLIDVESFVNFYIFQELVKDADFGEYSTRYYFKEGLMYAGPPWDLDLTMGNVSTDKEEFKYVSYNNVEGAGDVYCQVLSETGIDGSNRMTANTGSVYGLWADTGDYYYWLCRDPWFMSLVKQRWGAVRVAAENLAMENELGTSLIDRYLLDYLIDLESNFADGGRMLKSLDTECGLTNSKGADSNNGLDRDACWIVDVSAHMSEWQEPADTYIENVELLRQWLIKRAAYLDSQWGPFVYTPKLAVQ